MNSVFTPSRTFRAAAATVAVAALSFTAVACSSEDAKTEASAGVTLTNCGEEVTYPATAKKMVINDGNIISLALAAGAADQISAVSSVNRDLPILSSAYGDAINQKTQISKEYPNLEEVLAAEPDVFIAGWGYGFGEDKGLTPDALKEHGIGSYILTESCRQADNEGAAQNGNGDPGHKRGVVDPWEAIRIDLRNIAKLTGNEGTADKVVADIDARLEKLQAAPQAGKKPVGFVFDSAGDAPFTSGAFGAPQGILDKAGAVNGTESIKDTWTTTTWENIAQMQPDFITLVEYPGQSFEEKIKALRTNPATKDLPAVKENRFINLPYAMWTESPLNVDAAEHVRKGLERFGLVPASDIEAKLSLPKDLPGAKYFR
nr:ABC transporter substrate-binding protein [Corynebacterium lactis]